MSWGSCSVRFARSDGVWRWSARGKRGMIAFHDVDDHPGANLACRWILKRKGFVPWGYCPNIVVFRRE